MTRTKALQIGALTLWPVVYAWSLAAIFGYLVFVVHKGPADVPVLFKTVWVIHFLTMGEIALLLIYFVTHLLKIEDISRNKKAAWAVALVFVNIAAMPVYWYLNIWKPAQIRRSA